MHNSYENVVRQLMGFLNLSPFNCLLEKKMYERVEILDLGCCYKPTFFFL